MNIMRGEHSFVVSILDGAARCGFLASVSMVGFVFIIICCYGYRVIALLLFFIIIYLFYLFIYSVCM